jgi:hypothetical protein
MAEVPGIRLVSRGLRLRLPLVAADWAIGARSEHCRTFVTSESAAKHDLADEVNGRERPAGTGLRRIFANIAGAVCGFRALDLKTF